MYTDLNKHEYSPNDLFENTLHSLSAVRCDHIHFFRDKALLANTIMVLLIVTSALGCYVYFRSLAHNIGGQRGALMKALVSGQCKSAAGDLRAGFDLATCFARHRFHC